MDKNEIIKLYGTDYPEMTKRLLASADLASMIRHPDERICIKPNLVSPTPAEYGATTHPEIVSGIIEYLFEHNFRNIVIAEGSWIGDRTSDAFEYCGYNTIKEKYGVPLIDAQKEKTFTADCAGEPVTFCSFLKDVDFLINVPVLKGHSQTGITCALKNLKGVIPNSEKRSFHARGLHRPIAHMNTFIKQDFIVVDHICGDPEIEDGGHPLTRNCIMAALDPVLVDAYTCRILGVSPSKAAYIHMAAELGVGSDDLAGLMLSVLEGEDNESLPENFRMIRFPDSVNDVSSCSACYTNLTEALDRLESEGLLCRLREKICIGQGFKGKTGILGVGSCTSGFRHSLKGCPPSIDEIHRFLREFILD